MLICLPLERLRPGAVPIGRPLSFPLGARIMRAMLEAPTNETAADGLLWSVASSRFGPRGCNRAHPGSRIRRKYGSLS